MSVLDKIVALCNDDEMLYHDTIAQILEVIKQYRLRKLQKRIEELKAELTGEGVDIAQLEAILKR